MNLRNLPHIFRSLIATILLVGGVGISSAQHIRQFIFTGANGAVPGGGVLVDDLGNFYGTTVSGGLSNLGVVYELSPTSDGKVTETVLYNFTGSNGDGANPIGDLIFDQQGNLYGVTQGGGSTTGTLCFPIGCGTVFELSPPASQGGPWTETVLYIFQGGTTDGAQPLAGLAIDASGNLYGTTLLGGSNDLFCSGGFCGTVFELSPPASEGDAWTETILYMFQGQPDGQQPVGGVTFDQAGNLYGTTSLGGEFGAGTVFVLNPPLLGGSWTEAVLHSFTGSDGNQPMSGLTLAPNGAFLGTASEGGSRGLGTIFELGPPSGGNWSFEVVHNFGVNDGSRPLAALTVADANTAYGTTTIGAGGGGNVFRITNRGGAVVYTVLIGFGGGSRPAARMTLFNDALYGTTSYGGYKSHGTVFQLTR